MTTDQPFHDIATAIASLSRQWRISNLIKWREINGPSREVDTKIEQYLGIERKR